MSSNRIIAAANDLLESLPQDVSGTSFILATKGVSKSAERAVICVTKESMFASVLMMLKDGFDELAEIVEQQQSELTREQLISMLRDKLTATLTLLQCEEIAKH